MAEQGRVRSTVASEVLVRVQGDPFNKVAELLEEIGKAMLAMESSDALADFLGVIEMAKGSMVTLQRAEAERREYKEGLENIVVEPNQLSDLQRVEQDIANAKKGNSL